MTEPLIGKSGNKSTNQTWAVVDGWKIEQAKRSEEGREHLRQRRGYVYPTRNKSSSHALPYNKRDFIAWDTEGGESAPGEPQPVILFGCSAGSQLRGRDLSTADMLRCISNVGQWYPGRIHISFAFTYDVNQILKDLTPRYLNELKDKGTTNWKNYRINVLWRKWLQVTDFDNRTTDGRYITVRIFDLFTFYNSSFVAAVASVLDKNDPRLSIVQQVKQERSDFSYDQLTDKIVPYWKLELELLVSMAERMRENLLNVGLEVTGWYGPGAVASAVLKKHNIGKALQRELPEGVVRASQYAYYGGRFEQFRTGIKHGRFYSYDIRSAYPDALRTLPNIGCGTWRHSYADDWDGRIRDFSLYKIEYRSPGLSNTTLHMPHPFPYRAQDGRVSFPLRTVSWVWGCELAAAWEFFSGYITIFEAWEFTADDMVKPFKFIETMYLDRARYKREGNGSQLALKLAMNSIYGKLAQRVGWDEKTNQPPHWHQLEYAGYVTAYCRAKIFRAMMQNPLSIISVETDGLFTDEPLNLVEGTELGTWESDTFDSLMYVQSGVYFTGTNGEWTKARTRGFDRGKVGFEYALATVDDLSPIVGNVNRFVGMTSFRQAWNMPGWRSWNSAEHVVQWGGNGKRFHSDAMCPGCSVGDRWHYTILSDPFGGESHPHPLPWKNETNSFTENSTQTDGDLLVSSHFVD